MNFWILPVWLLLFDCYNTTKNTYGYTEPNMEVDSHMDINDMLLM